MPTFIKNHKKTAVIMGCTVVLIAILFCVFIVLNGDHTPGDAEKPTLTVQTPRKLSLSATDTVTVDVTISALGEALYPAASMNIAFDASRLEFLGVEEGNVFIKSDNSSGQSLPEWSYTTAACNESGRVNVMYLDMTGGKNAYSKELLNEDYNVVIRLKFRLRGSVRAGDVCDLVVEDAVFAASDETQSLAMITNTLAVVNGKIVIGE
ncbi:MAG: hypothetical protein IJY12_00560 [Clostridia bacterium]|nr:hypothetical protein [Clostridia bacterium]